MMRDFEADRELISKATPGPWMPSSGCDSVDTKHADHQAVSGWYGGRHNSVCVLSDGEYIDNGNYKNDAEFIAQAREGWPAALTELEIRGKLLDCKQEQIDLWREENKRLRIALHDAINRPMGVVPDSAVEFYDQDRGCE